MPVPSRGHHRTSVLAHGDRGRRRGDQGEATDGPHHRGRARGVGPDREIKGGAVVKLRDERGALLALRLRPGQVRTVATGLAGIVAAVD